MDNPDMTPLAMLPVFGWILYRRVRSQLGRQAFRPRRQTLRVVLLGISIALLAIPASTRGDVALAVAGGLLASVAIALVSLRYTRFEFTPAGDGYYPHPLVGATLAIVVAGRFLYRMSELGGPHSQPPPIAAQSALTYGLFALLLGYYFVYGVGLLVVRRRKRGGE